MQAVTHAPLRGGYVRYFLFTLLFAASLSVSAQNSTPTLVQPAPQSARQALIEMFMGKRDDDFSKHLPEDARHILIHKGETAEYSTVLKLATLGRAAQEQGAEAFDVGPNILVIRQKGNSQTIEVAVEHDSLLGEEDEIELSFRVYKNGQPQSLPIVPRLIFTLKPEKEIWRLTEITVAGHIPLTDPDYLKELRREQDEINERMVQMRVITLTNMETAYAAKHPDIGYTCTLSTLLGSTPGSQDIGARTMGAQDAPMLEQPQVAGSSQGTEDYAGYHFALSGCNGSPATKYRAIASPSDPDATTRTFCTDESGAVKSIAEGQPSSCFNRGQDVNSPPPQPPAPIED